MHMKKPWDLEKTLNKPNNFLAQTCAPPTLFSQGLVGTERNFMPSESTPLVPISKGRYAFERLGIDSREVWSIIIIVLLFIGKGVQPFVTDIVHVTQAALIEDKTLDITFTALGGLVGVQDFTSGVAKLSVPIVLRNFGPRNVYLTLDGSSSWSRCWEPT